MNGNKMNKMWGLLSMVAMFGLILIIIYTGERLMGKCQQPNLEVEWTTQYMEIRAYCPCEECCGEYADGITASGYVIEPGACFVAADKRFPFNTFFIVPSYNNDEPVPVLDRGGLVTGNRLDIFFHTHEEALKWGVKWLEVKVLSFSPSSLRG